MGLNGFVVTKEWVLSVIGDAKGIDCVGGCIYAEQAIQVPGEVSISDFGIVHNNFTCAVERKFHVWTSLTIHKLVVSKRQTDLMMFTTGLWLIATLNVFSSSCHVALSKMCNICEGGFGH